MTCKWGMRTPIHRPLSLVHFVLPEQTTSGYPREYFLWNLIFYTCIFGHILWREKSKVLLGISRDLYWETQHTSQRVCRNPDLIPAKGWCRMRAYEFSACLERIYPECCRIPFPQWQFYKFQFDLDTIDDKSRTPKPNNAIMSTLYWAKLKWQEHKARNNELTVIFSELGFV